MSGAGVTTVYALLTQLYGGAVRFPFAPDGDLRCPIGLHGHRASTQSPVTAEPDHRPAEPRPRGLARPRGAARAAAPVARMVQRMVTDRYVSAFRSCAVEPRGGGIATST